MVAMMKKIKKSKLAHAIVRVAKETAMRYKYYKWTIGMRNNHPLVVIFCDRRRKTMGLTDRFKGIVSMYAYSLAKNIPFRCVFNHPFELSQFMVPNLYDWMPGKNELATRTADVKVLILHGENGNRLLAARTAKQLHTYANRDYLPLINSTYGTTFEWGALFNKLFKPSELLASSMERHLDRIGSEYIGCVFRFQSLLGDFYEGDFPTLSEEERVSLILKCKNFLKTFVSKWKIRALVTSDSRFF